MSYRDREACAAPVGAGMPAKQATRWMAPASPVFAGAPAPTEAKFHLPHVPAHEADMSYRDHEAGAAPVGAGMPAKQATRWMAPASPVFAGAPAPTEAQFHLPRRCQPMKHRQAGLTLIELMVALALTAMLGVMLAALVNGWLKVRERLQATNQEASVLDFCLAVERRFDSPVMRRLYEQRLPLASRWLDWQPASNQLLWVAITGMPEAEGGSRLQRQRLRFEVREQRLLLESSADLYAAAAPRWVQRDRLERVSAMNVLYYQGGRWLAWPSDQPAHPGRGVRLALQRDGAPYVCTFALPWGRS